MLAKLVGNNPAVIRDFLQSFRTSASAVGEELCAACREGRARLASDAAHKLKASARAVGALTLGELCAEIELAGKAGSNTTLLRCCLDSSAN